MRIESISSTFRETVNQGVVVSLCGHILLTICLIWVYRVVSTSGPLIIAAGSGEGGSGGYTEVGVVGLSELLRFRPDLDLSTIGPDSSAPPGLEEVVPAPTDVDPATAEALPSHEALPDQKRPSSARTTDRPVASLPDRPYSRERLPGGASGTGAVVGVPGSPFPGKVAGGIGIGGGPGGLGGIPGGSEYGRRLQQALIGYYRLAPSPQDNPRFVIVRIQLDRQGRVLSLENGRLGPKAFLEKSGKTVIDYRVEGALLELDRNPIPFPRGFLPTSDTAAVEIYFQY